MSRPKKRKRRSIRVEAHRATYAGDVLTITEFRSGCEYVVHIVLGSDNVYRAEIIHERCVEHVSSVREARRSKWQRAHEACERMGAKP